MASPAPRKRNRFAMVCWILLGLTAAATLAMNAWIVANVVQVRNTGARRVLVEHGATAVVIEPGQYLGLRRADGVDLLVHAGAEASASPRRVPLAATTRRVDVALDENGALSVQEAEK